MGFVGDGIVDGKGGVVGGGVFVDEYEGEGVCEEFMVVSMVDGVVFVKDGRGFVVI